MKLLVALVVLALLAVAADAAAEETAEARIGKRLSASVQGADEIEVEVRGRPFLLQVVQGRFSGMDLHMPSLERRGVTVEDVELALDDVAFSLGDLLEGSGQVRIEGGSGTASVSEDALNAALANEGVQGSVALEGDTATVSAAGVEAAVDRVAVVDGALEFRSAALGRVRLPLPRFIDEVRYRDARVEESRVVVSIELPSTSISPDAI